MGCSETVRAASNCSDSHVRRQVTGISFLCAPHYLNLFRNVPIPEGRSLRRASGLVLVGDQDVIQMGSGESVLGSRQVFTKPTSSRGLKPAYRTKALKIHCGLADSNSE